MLSPKRSKFRKWFRGKNRGVSLRGSQVDFGEFGLKSLSRSLVTANQIESARKVISHHTKREGKVWLRIFPVRPITGKSAGERMGSGKGDVKGYVVPVSPGRILFELSGVSFEVAKEAFRKAGDKLPLKTKIVTKEEN